MQFKQINKRTILSCILILILIPLTIIFGVYFFNDRKYYFISSLIIIYTMIPFFMLFEDRKPNAREIIVIAVLVALAVAGRAAFYMIPQFKPVVAIVIIAGISFGPEAGFLTGALSGFVSNFFFGQGPWTPWQMFSFGIIGYFAGLIFTNKEIKKNKMIVCLFGGIATLIIYGGIMDLASVIMITPNFNLAIIKAAYLSGIYFNLIHGAATVIFLFFLYKPIMEKLKRIKIKYGFLEK